MCDPSGLGDGLKTFGGQCVPEVTGHLEQVVVVAEHPVAQVVALEISPEAFDRVELGAVGRQVQEREVRRHLQRLGDVPAGVVEHQHDVGVGTGGPADEGQVLVHQAGVDGRGEERGGGAGDRVDGGEEVEPVVLGLLERGRPRALVGPDVRQRPLLADTGLVLEPDLDPAIGMVLAYLLDKRGASSSQRCIAAGSFLRCRGRGLRHDRPRRCKRSYAPSSV